MNIPKELENFLENNLSDLRQIDIGFEIFEFPENVKLIEFQEGYRINGVTKEREKLWHENWLVIGSSNADPLIYNADNGNVMFDRHGSGNWNPVTLFSNIDEMYKCLLALSKIVSEADEDLYDDDFNIQPKNIETMKGTILDVMGEKQGAKIIESFEITSY